MTREEAIKILKDGRENLYGALDKSVPYDQQHTLVALDIAIKAIEENKKLKEAVGKIKEEINKSIIISRLANCKGLADGLETALEFVNKHTEGLI